MSRGITVKPGHADKLFIRVIERQVDNPAFMPRPIVRCDVQVLALPRTGAGKADIADTGIKFG